MSTNESLTVTSLLDRAKGKGITESIRQGLVLWILAWFTAIASGLQTLAEFLFLPFELLIDVATQAVTMVILEPLGIISTGADVTAGEIDVFGVLALPFSVFIALATLFIVLLYLQFETSSGIIPGMIVDNRLVQLFFTTPEEEAEGED